MSISDTNSPRHLCDQYWLHMLHGASQLQKLELLVDTEPDAVAIEALRQALPRCRIPVENVGSWLR